MALLLFLATGGFFVVFRPKTEKEKEEYRQKYKKNKTKEEREIKRIANALITHFALPTKLRQ